MTALGAQCRSSYTYDVNTALMLSALAGIMPPSVELAPVALKPDKLTFLWMGAAMASQIALNRYIKQLYAIKSCLS